MCIGLDPYVPGRGLSTLSALKAAIVDGRWIYRTASVLRVVGQAV